MDVCIIGTGYVGLVAAACLAEMGNNVICIDSNPDIVSALSAGHVHIYEPGLEDMVKRNYQSRLRFSTDLAEGLTDALFILNCVGTPPRPDGSCDLANIEAVAHEVGKMMSDYKIIINKSTVPVGTADMVKQIIEKELQSRDLDLQFDVVSNPEFLKEGDAINDFMKPDRVIVGTDNIRTAKLLETLYAPFARSREKMIVMSIRSAEMTKYAANCMLATRISFMNEIANICERVGADVKDVRIGIGSDRRIGYSFIYPGVGYGGSCFPKDVKALIQTSRQNNYFPELISAVDSVNNRQKLILVEKIKNYFHEQGGVKGKTLAMWGLAFKANTDDIRESAAIETIKRLTADGMIVKAFDPEAGTNSRLVLDSNKLVQIFNDQYKVLEQSDALAVMTDWNQFRTPDLKKIKKLLKAPIIFDGRNLYSSSLLTSQGFAYLGVGQPNFYKDDLSS